MPIPIIKTLINQLWDKFWSYGIATRESVIQQVSYLIFIKWLETTGNTPEETMKWSYIRQIPDKKAMLEHVAGAVFPRLKTLPPTDFPYSAQIADAVFLIPNPLLLEEAMRLLDSIDTEIGIQLHEQLHSLDTLGDVYDHLIHDINPTADLLVRPTLPAHLTLLMCQLAQPVIDDLICDPACGLGDLLVAASQVILGTQTSDDFKYLDDDGFQRGDHGDLIAFPEVWERFKRQTFTGIEKDKIQLQSTTMNLMLHGVDRPLTFNEDILPTPSAGAKKKNPGYSLILSNLLTAGPVAAGSSVAINSIDLLRLMQRTMELLAPGGRAVLLVPNSFITTTSGDHAEWKKALLSTDALQGVIKLPANRPIPAGMENGSILFLQKKKDAGRKSVHNVQNSRPQPVWFCNMTTDGYKYTAENELLKLDANPLPALVSEFHQRSPGSATPVSTPMGYQAYWVSAQQITDSGFNWDAERHVPQKSWTAAELFKAASDALRTPSAKVLGEAALDVLGSFIGGPVAKAALSSISKALSQFGPISLEQVSVTQVFIRTYYCNDPFTFRDLQTDIRKGNPTIPFERLHQDVWDMLKATDPQLRQVFFDSRMATVYPAAYRFLRDKKAESGIYLLFLGAVPKPEKKDSHETPVL